MADNKVKFLRGTSNEYTVAEKDSDTIYFTTDDGKLYIGDKEVSGSDVTIDDALSDTSTNPVQNKVVKQAIDNKADKSLYGDTTINVGRKANTTVGNYSTAEGDRTTASGIGSHAEGYYTTASGDYSHAEGVNTTASGRSSHAEGKLTTASGKYSYAGGSDTKALKEAEFAYGKYNQSNDDTLFSIGDGTSDNVRHNAFEITKTGGKLHDKDIATTDLIPNPNLLINPDFKINQRGLSSYNADWIYTVDRWVSFGAVVSPNSSGGINISKKDNSDYFGFIQRTEILQSDCIDKNMTLSAKIDGEVLSGTIIRDDTEQSFFAIGDSSDRFIISSYSNNGIKYIITQLYGSKSYNIEWVKLEYGSNATQFTPPDTATELLKCMRYYETIMSAGCDRAVPANLLPDLRVEIDFQFKIPKRAIPSIATNTLRFVVTTSTGYSTLNLSVQQHASDINGMCLNTVDTVLTELPTYLLGVTVDTWGLGAFAVDAEIY